MKLVSLIKQIGAGAVEAGSPVALLPGVVTGTRPLEITVEQRFALTEQFLLVPERLTAYEVGLKHAHNYEDESTSGTATRITEEALVEPLVIRRGLEIGDNVLLLRMQGGETFVVLDRLVSES